MNLEPVAELLEMLTYRRPAFSRSEKKFIRRFIRPTGATPDAFGNFILRIGTAPVLWSAHTDTVHHWAGRQEVFVIDDMALSDSSCLGADDTTGCWLMLEMIRAGVEGLYVFHRAEEVGCLGSTHIATNTPELLDGIRCAIAFDRQGYYDVITHQLGQKGCTDTFARTLGDGLGLGMTPDSGGVYTDTERYIGIIPECCNLSVGYERQHTAYETQDLAFALELRNALVNLDLVALVESCRKEPGPVEYDIYGGFRSYGSSGKGTENTNADTEPDWWEIFGDTPEHAFEECANCGAYGIDTETLYDSPLCVVCYETLTR